MLTHQPEVILRNNNRLTLSATGSINFYGIFSNATTVNNIINGNKVHMTGNSVVNNALLGIANASSASGICSMSRDTVYHE